MIRFYPRDIGRWRGLFNFQPKMLPLPDYKDFNSPQEFLDFLVEHKVRLDDPDNKLMFIKRTANNDYECVQWTSIGRIEVSSDYIIERLERMVTPMPVEDKKQLIKDLLGVKND